MQASEFKKYIVLGLGTLPKEDFDLLRRFETLKSFGYQLIRPIETVNFIVPEGAYCLYIKAKQSRRLSEVAMTYDVTEDNPLETILDSIIKREQGIKNGSIRDHVGQTLHGKSGVATSSSGSLSILDLYPQCRIL